MMRFTLRLDLDDTRHIGHGKIKLIELIAHTGSISAAARAMDMSYRRAWLLINDVNCMFLTPIIETQLGGRGGGHARLTDEGQKLISLYRAIETKMQQQWGDELALLGHSLRPTEVDAPLTSKPNRV
jgi:molybdate transport system regulatory protein